LSVFRPLPARLARTQVCQARAMLDFAPSVSHFRLPLKTAASESGGRRGLGSFVVLV
jgi:hypothetical protein